MDFVSCSKEFTYTRGGILCNVRKVLFLNSEGRNISENSLIPLAYKLPDLNPWTLTGGQGFCLFFLPFEAIRESQ